MSNKDLKHPVRDLSKLRGEFNRWVNQYAPPDFYFADVDAISYKVSTRTLRIFEVKKEGEEITPGQRKTLPLLADIISDAILRGKISKESGVFRVQGNAPYLRSTVSRYGLPVMTWTLAPEELAMVAACRPMPSRTVSGMDAHSSRRSDVPSGG